MIIYFLEYLLYVSILVLNNFIKYVYLVFKFIILVLIS